jgi:putative thioredoxin
MRANTDWIIDVGEADFEREVLERSERVPVVVDFWAPWCGPCRTLGPLLERLVQEHAGGVVLARVNVDAAPGIAAQFGARSIPMVLGFRDRAIRGEFVGAQPEAAVRQFLASILPSEADTLASEADTLREAGDAAGAEARYRDALAREARHGRALYGLAGLLGERGEAAEALDLLDRVLPHEVVAEDAERLAARLRLRGEGGEDPDALRARLEADPDDLGARIDLGRALASSGRNEEALETFLEAVRRDPEYDDGAARLAMLDLFELLGPDAELTQRFRGELGRALFR